MVDIGQIATAMSLAAKAYDLSKKANVLELQETMMSLREAIVDARDEVLTLRNKIRELEEKLAKRDAVEWDGIVYWTRQGDERVGPFCPVCYGKNERLLRLVASRDINNRPAWSCHVCGSTMRDRPERQSTT